MSDTDRLLELIEDGIAAHGGELGGWTRQHENQLQLFDGRVTLRAEIHPSPGEHVLHSHVVATLHDYDDEELDACVMGVGESEQALAEAAMIWITCIAGPIKSLLDGQPVCVTVETDPTNGEGSADRTAGNFGLAGLRGYVGPSIARWLEDAQVPAALDDTKPWFQFAAEAAAPRRVHIAKSTITSNGKTGWRRELEIDGHELSHKDRDWVVGLPAPEVGYLIRFAVFEFPSDSTYMLRRAELDRTIRYFAEQFSQYDKVHELMATMVEQGIDPDTVHEVESISMIAFGRTLFEHLGIDYPSTIIRARRDGRVEQDVPLMSIPAFARARALAKQLRKTLPTEQFQALCCYSAESNAILQSLDANRNASNLSGAKFYPCVVPDREVSQETMNRALAALDALVERGKSERALKSTILKKPWWKFW